MTQSQQLIILAYDKGYRIINNNCITPKGKILAGTIKQHPVPYRQFSIRTSSGARTVFFHSLMAYQLYQEEYFKDGIVARHLDGNSLNNLPDNIKLGTMKDNTLDIPSKRRSAKNKQGNITKKKLLNGMREQIINDFKLNNLSPQELMKKYQTCLNTIYLILKNPN